jgi:transcriptional regulator with XRE-family HTH domain
MLSGKRLRVLLGRRLRASRLSLGFEAEHFADELGLSTETYTRIEQGEMAPPLNALIYAAKITGKSLDFLLTGRRFRRGCEVLIAALF